MKSFKCCAGTKHPVVIFCYNRPEKLKQLLQSCGTSLQGRRLYLIVDGAKNENDEIAQSSLLQVFRGNTEEASCKIIRHSSNLGPRFAIPLGLELVFAENDSVIILEDDLIVSKLFFTFADRALTEVEDNNFLSGFIGYMVPCSQNQENVDRLIMRPSNICWPWGWGTTKRAWKHYQDGLESYSIRNFYKVSRALSPSIFIRTSWTLAMMLTKQGKNNSWFYRWQFHCCRNHMRFLVPSKNLVANAGCDSSGTHTSKFAEPSGGYILKTAEHIMVDYEPLSDARQDLFYTTANGLTLTKFLRMILSTLVPLELFRSVRAALR